MLVRSDRAVHALLALRVLKDQLDVVEDIAAVVDIVEAADADDELRRRAEHPAGDIHLVRGKLGRQASGQIAILPPVGVPVGAAFLDRLVPGVIRERVPVPLGLHMRDASEQSLGHHLLGRLVELAVAPLQSDLEDLLGPFIRQRPQGVDLLRLKDHALLAEDVLTGQQRVPGDGEVRKQRRGDDHGFDVFVRQQLLVRLVLARVGPRRLGAALQTRLVDVAHRDAAGVAEGGHVPQQVTAPGAGSDQAVAHLVGGRAYFLDGGDRKRAGRLHEIATGGIILS